MVLNLIVTECGQVKPELNQAFFARRLPGRKFQVSFAGGCPQACAIFRLKSCRYDAGLSPGGFGFGVLVVTPSRTIRANSVTESLCSDRSDSFYNYIPPSAAEVREHMAASQADRSAGALSV